MNHHHRRRHAWLSILLPVILTGCSTTMGSRFGGTPQAKSIVVNGDRAVSVATGEPGGRVVAEADPDPRPNPKGRISGRVIDDQGEPIPNATVRLADGGTKGGKDIRATTDRTGAFTLNGLRPGSSYSLVAESGDDQQLLTGSAKAKTTDSRVEITLLSDEAAAKAASQRGSRPSKVRPISNPVETGEGSTDEGRPVINREDIGSPADAGEVLDPGPSTESGRPQLIPPQAATAWQNTKVAKKPVRGDDDSDTIASSSDDSPRRPRVVTVGAGNSEDEDGPNPLPPAIEPDSADEPVARKPTSARRKPATTRPPVKQIDSGEMTLAPEASAVEPTRSRRPEVIAAEETVVASTELPPVAAPPTASAAALLPEPVATTSAEPSSPMPATSGPPELPPVGAAAPASLLTSAPPGLPPVTSTTNQELPPQNPASPPVFASREPAAPATTPVQPARPAEYNPFALVAASPPASASNPVVEKIADRATLKTAAEAIVPAAADDSDLAAPVPAGPKMKWGDLAATTPNPNSKPPIKVEPTKVTLASSIARRFRPSAPAATAKVDTTIASCSYDARLLRLNDFRLPDLEGKPVRFQDLGADFVLLDFWGTWCSPCLESIPHLIELQKKYGPSRLQVVGIACEEVPTEQRKAKVEQTARRLGINYPILLSTMDGKPCPVQQALAIQAMPTMILLDRKGKILWRSTGSTPANESRLDRVLASQMSWSETTRR